MTTLAPKLPYTHPFAGGYPRVGGQSLPTDPDAIDYLNRVAAADGAAVEVGVAMAVDAFVKGCKADSAGYAGDPTRTVWDAIKSACIMCGARTLSGALVSLRQYGPELWANQTPTVYGGSGDNTGEWISASSTMVCNGVGPEFTRPRFDFNVGSVSGVTYKIEGRLSGDLASVRFVLGASQGVPDGDGNVSFTAEATAAPLYGYLNGQLGASSVRIESLSIKEVINDAENVANNFASGDYDRTTGLKGDGSTKYLDTNRAGNADGQDDSHHAVYATDGGTGLHYKIGAYSASSGSFVAQRTTFASGGNRPSVYQNVGGAGAYTNATISGNATGFYGGSRATAAEFSYRLPGDSGTHAAASVTPGSLSIYAFGFNNNGSFSGQFDGRLAFYSIGSAIPDLAALDTRVTQLITGIKFHSLTGLVATDYDPDTVAYIVAAYEAGGTL